MEYNKPIKVGQSSNEGSQAGTIYNNKGISPTISAGTHGYAIGLVLVSPKLTNTQSKSTKNTSQPIRSTAMSQISNGQMFQILNYFVGVSLVRLSALQAREKVLKIQGEPYFLKLSDVSKKSNPSICYLKM